MPQKIKKFKKVKAALTSSPDAGSQLVPVENYDKNNNHGRQKDKNDWKRFQNALRSLPEDHMARTEFAKATTRTLQAQFRKQWLSDPTWEFVEVLKSKSMARLNKQSVQYSWKTWPQLVQIFGKKNAARHRDIMVKDGITKSTVAGITLYGYDEETNKIEYTERQESAVICKAKLDPMVDPPAAQALMDEEPPPATRGHEPPASMEHVPPPRAVAVQPMAELMLPPTLVQIVHDLSSEELQALLTFVQAKVGK